MQKIAATVRFSEMFCQLTSKIKIERRHHAGILAFISVSFDTVSDQPRSAISSAWLLITAADASPRTVHLVGQNACTPRDSFLPRLIFCITVFLWTDFLVAFQFCVLCQLNHWCIQLILWQQRHPDLRHVHNSACISIFPLMVLICLATPVFSPALVAAPS